MKIILKEAELQQAVFEYLNNRFEKITGDPAELYIFWDAKDGLTCEIDLEDQEDEVDENQNPKPSP